MANHAIHKAVTSGSQGVPARCGVSSSKHAWTKAKSPDEIIF